MEVKDLSIVLRRIEEGEVLEGDGKGKRKERGGG